MRCYASLDYSEHADVVAVLSTLILSCNLFKIISWFEVVVVVPRCSFIYCFWFSCKLEYFFLLSSDSSIGSIKLLCFTSRFNWFSLEQNPQELLFSDKIYLFFPKLVFFGASAGPAEFCYCCCSSVLCKDPIVLIVASLVESVLFNRFLRFSFPSFYFSSSSFSISYPPFLPL